MWRKTKNRDTGPETTQTPITINPCPNCGRAHHYVLETRSSTAKRLFKPQPKTYAGRWPCPSGGIFELKIPLPGTIEWAGPPTPAESAADGSDRSEDPR